MDEIGNLSYEVQVQLLRALQERKVKPTGSNKEVEVDIRVIAVTNEDLSEAVKKGEFREDLYHRLSVILIHVPSLNDRKDDIPTLANYFVNEICQDYGMPVKAFSAEALKELQKINWTGNIRELRNVVERLGILSDKKITEKEVLQFAGKK